MNIHKGTTFNELEQELLSPEERIAMEIQTELIGELIKARNSKKISQRDFEALVGIKQPMIARIETGKTVPNLDTIVKMFVSLGIGLKTYQLK